MAGQVDLNLVASMRLLDECLAYPSVEDAEKYGTRGHEAEALGDEPFDATGAVNMVSVSANCERTGGASPVGSELGATHEGVADSGWVTVKRRGTRGTRRVGLCDVARPVPEEFGSLGRQANGALHVSVEQIRASGFYDCLDNEEVGDPGDSIPSPSEVVEGSVLTPVDLHMDVCGTCEFDDTIPSTRTWKRRRRRKLVGALLPHVIFLQYLFRRTRRIRPGCWSRGGMRRLFWWRPTTVFGCCGGARLAAECEFQAQQTRAREALAWYRCYTRLLQRLSSGHAPTALVTFCSQGGTSEGVRRAGGAVHGQDIRDQHNYVRRFGPETFTKGDSADPSEVRVLRRKAQAFLTFASPPCKAYSTARFRGEASEAPLIDATRDACKSAGGLFAIENVVGAKADLRGDVALLRGAYFGERVDRPRMFETNFKVHVDEALRVPGNQLRMRTCLGERRRWRRLDPFGRPEQQDCCRGNIWAVQGDKPLRCTQAECSVAMGLDVGHMDYAGLAQAIPPSYASYVFGQACMREVERKFGIPVITFDEMLANPAASRRKMHHWLAGAGGVSPDQGVEIGAVRPAASSGAAERATAEPVEPSSYLAGGIVSAPRYKPVHTDGSEDAVLPPTESRVEEAEWRELEYSWAGGFDVVVGSRSAWGAIQPIANAQLREKPTRLLELRGQNVLCVLGRSRVVELAAELAVIAREAPGTRFTVEARGAWSEAQLRARGFELVRRVFRGEPSYATGEKGAQSSVPRSYWSCGEPVSEMGSAVDYDALEAHMDPFDRSGALQEPKSAKAARSYMPIPWERERWDVGLPEELDRIMAKRGVGIYPVEELGPTEVPFYRWASNEGLLKSILEADRAIIAGAMEYVPASRLEEVSEYSTIHPWTIVDQGGGKWRLCHDYSVGTNKRVATAPFALPSVWDVLPDIKEGSYFAKYDIRDGFWHVPIADDSKKRLVVRHPGTGRLIWATRLPFGYVESPRLFCGITEAIMARLRKRVAGLGISYYVFVDDVLCVGDTEELTRMGMKLLEEEFESLGVIWAPHKRRGPCQCIEFLGLLLSNVKGQRGVTLTRKRLRGLMTAMAEWRERRPAQGILEADPRELASFLGKLVFASQVVPGGRTYMQGMLSQFKGLVVDWRRGTVQPAEGQWRALTVTDAFWRDLRWWEHHLERRSLTPMRSREERRPVAVTGTDASGWGTGQVVWLDGAREEASLLFTSAEKRRPINWRELLGVVRVAMLWGPRLRGHTVLIETDNMAAKGAVSKMASKAADMQELIRRLLRLAERHGFTVRVTHTPGVKLERPDQTSRGDPVEEPRARVVESLFRDAERRWGPFNGLIGAEREWASVGDCSGDGREVVWAHPTFNTVGSAMRRVLDAMIGSGNERSRAVMVVPDDVGPRWSSLLKHGLTVGRLEPGHAGTERLGLSRWQPSRVIRPMQFVLFPRAAGSFPRRVMLTHREGAEVVKAGVGSRPARVAGEGYTLSSDGEALRLPVLPGSFVYSLPEKEGCGGLYQVVSDEVDLVARYAYRMTSKEAKKARVPWFEIARVGDEHAPDPMELWTVDHLVEAVPGATRVKSVLYQFDFETANREIKQAGGGWRDPNRGWLLPDSSGSDGEVVSSGEEDEARGSAVTPAHLFAEGYSPFDAGASSTVQVEDLDAVVRDLDALHLQQSQVKTGPEGKVAAPTFTDRGEAAQGQSGEVRQPNQYAAMRCAGCQAFFRLGETVVSAAGAMVHDQPRCRSKAAELVLAQAEMERCHLAEPETFYGVFSEEVGESGVYALWEQVARLQELSHAERFGVRVEPFESYDEAAEFVKQCTWERAGGAAPAGKEKGVKGSLMMRARQSERLHPDRLARVVACFEGKCGHAHDVSVSTACRGGCGRHLHMETCAMLGRGYAAIGNFTCTHCRLLEVTNSPATATPELIGTVTRTMVLELAQGKETTAAGYSEFSSLEERYALGMGMVLAEGQLMMPRHSEEAFKNFLTWFVQDAGRARSVESLVRTAGALMMKTGLTDHTKSKAVRAHLKELMSGASMEHEPSTTGTPSMLKLIIEKLIDARFTDPFIASRDKVQVVIEGVGGCRIGEVVGGGDGHGLLANNTCILEDPEAEKGSICSTVVELKLEHSKTGYSRYLDMAGVTQTSRIPCAKLLQEYWDLAGFTIREDVWSGVRVRRPDFWVVRVGLLIEHEKYSLMVAKLKGCVIPCVKKYVGSTLVAAKSRLTHKEETKRYVNVARGDSAVINAAAASRFWQELRDIGLSVTIVPGPLLLSTTGGRSPSQKTMPITDSSVNERINEWLAKAHRQLNPLCKAAGHDPDLELEPGQEAHWTSHSLRRLANSTAKRWMVKTNITEAMIDLYFGWNEKLLKKMMQNHYNSLSVRERMMMAKITGMM